MSSKPAGHLGSIIRRHWVITTIIILGLLFVGYRWLMSPHINPDPKQKILIRGQFPFSQGLDLKLHVTYQSRNPICKQTVRVFWIIPATSTKVDRLSALYLPTRREGEDRYSAEVMLDHFFPGLCDWQYGGMGYGFSGGKIGPSSITHGMSPFPVQKKTLTYVCGYQVVSNSSITTPSITVVSCDFPVMTKDATPTGSNAELNFIWKGN
jgi:hypothetical protein